MSTSSLYSFVNTEQKKTEDGCEVKLYLLSWQMFFLTLCLRSDSRASIYIINQPSLSEHGDLALIDIKTAVKSKIFCF